jgi:hypothetical protein
MCFASHERVMQMFASAIMRSEPLPSQEKERMASSIIENETAIERTMMASPTASTKSERPATKESDADYTNILESLFEFTEDEDDIVHMSHFNKFVKSACEEADVPFSRNDVMQAMKDLGGREREKSFSATYEGDSKRVCGKALCGLSFLPHIEDRPIIVLGASKARKSSQNTPSKVAPSVTPIESPEDSPKVLERIEDRPPMITEKKTVVVDPRKRIGLLPIQTLVELRHIFEGNHLNNSFYYCNSDRFEDYLEKYKVYKVQSLMRNDNSMTIETAEKMYDEDPAVDVWTAEQYEQKKIHNSAMKKREAEEARKEEELAAARAAEYVEYPGTRDEINRVIASGEVPGFNDYPLLELRKHYNKYQEQEIVSYLSSDASALKHMEHIEKTEKMLREYEKEKKRKTKEAEDKANHEKKIMEKLRKQQEKLEFEQRQILNSIEQQLTTN